MTRFFRSSRLIVVRSAITRYLHTMYRITNPEKSRAFYETLGFESRRELLIERDGELEAFVRDPDGNNIEVVNHNRP